MVIVYCNTCGVRIPDNELESGTAAKDAEGNTYCAKCAPANSTKSPSSRVMAAQSRGASGASGAPAAARETRPSRTGIPPARHSSREIVLPQRSGSGRREPVAELVPLEPAGTDGLDAKPKSFKLAVAIGVGGLVFFVGALLLSLSRKGPPTAEEADAKTDAAKPAYTASAQPLEAAKPVAEPGRPASPAAEDQKKAEAVTEAPHTPAFTKPPDEAKPEEKPPEGNLVTDSGFESGKWGPWKSWSNVAVMRQLDDARSGNHCLRLNPGKAGCGQSLTGLTPNTTYLLTGWGKTGKGDSVKIGVKEYGADERAQTITQDTYTQVSVTFTTGASNTSAMVFCYRDNAKTYAYCDDIYVVPQGGAQPAAVATPEAPTPPATPITAVLTDDVAWQTATNLLPLLDLPQDATPNTWKLQNGAAVCPKTGAGKLHLPYQPSAEYDLRVTFTRTDANGVLVQYLTGGGHSFVWVLNAASTPVTAFSQIRNQGVSSNASKTPLNLQNGRKYTSVVQVRSDSVTAFLDGKPLVQWKTDYKDMSVPQQWKMHGDTMIGLGNENCSVTYHAIEVLDLSGKGKATRTAAPLASAPGTDAKPETLAAALKLSAAEEATLEYEKALSDVYALLAKDGFAAARARLDKAGADSKLTFMQPALRLDAELAAYAEDLRKAALAGAALLVDKRPFTFTRADNKQVKTGKGSSISVLGVKGDDIEIEESIGGAKAQAKIGFEQLGPLTRFELAEIGLPLKPEKELQLAFGTFLLLQSGNAEATLKQVHSHLAAARKAQAPADKLNHLAGRIAFYEKDQGAEAAYHKVDPLLKEKKWEEAKAFIEGFCKEYVGTKSLAKLSPTMEQHWAEIQQGLSPIKPGVWAAYWSGDGGNKFKTFQLGRAETEVHHDWGAGSPDAKVPVDNFGMKMRGLLRIEKEGKYAFRVAADDNMQLTIDGRKVADSGKKEGEVSLSKGDHELFIQYSEGGGSASYSVKWKPEGGGFEDVPASALWHDTRQIAKYEQK